MVFRSDYELGLLHGDMSQYERNEILTSFKKQEFRVLVATDVAGTTNIHHLQAF